MVDVYALIGILPDAALIVASDGKIVNANAQAAFLFSYSAGKLLELKVEDLLPEDVRGQHVGHRERYIASPHPRPMAPGSKLRARRSNGSVFDVEVSLAPVEGGTIAVIRDVSSRKQQVDEETTRRLVETQSMVIDLQNRLLKQQQ